MAAPAKTWVCTWDPHGSGSPDRDGGGRGDRPGVGRCCVPRTLMRPDPHLRILGYLMRSLQPKV